MKIRKVTEETLPKAIGLLKQSFARSNYEINLVEKLHNNNKYIEDWVCIHVNKVIGYIAFTNAYDGKDTCGLHLAPVAVKPEYQNQGIAAELIRFALRQEVIKKNTVYVLGKTHYYERFGFSPCDNPRCSFAKNNRNFLRLGDAVTHSFTVGYEKEFGGA